MSPLFSFLLTICFLLSSSHISALHHRLKRQIGTDLCPNPNGNACLFVDCLNGGNCIEDSTTLDCFKCQCAPGYTGKICDSQITILPVGCTPGCLNGGICNTNVCACRPGYTGSLCETRDYCLPNNPCQNGGRCTSTSASYACDCTGTGYTGAVCTEIIQINPCSTNPCQNGGQCSLNGGTTICSCIAGYTGAFCQVPPFPCSSTPCENGGKCELITANTYGCVCPEDYTGDRCQNYVLEKHPCVTMPSTVCQNGGVCTVNGAGYICKCASGWTGTNCQTNEIVSSCEPNPCGIHGTCTPLIAPSGPIAYCNCEAQWTGRFCDVNMNVSCPVGYCLSGGTCRLVGNVPYCDCPAMYTGVRCESVIGGITTTTTTIGPVMGPCSPNPCKNGGTCFTDNVIFACVCVLGWTGTTCIVPSGIVVTTTLAPSGSPCVPNPCFNGGVCYRNGNVFACACLSLWTGDRCQLYQGETTTSTFTTPSFGITCANRPCRNGGTCYGDGVSYSCYCGQNSVYSGKNCEIISPPVVSNCPLNCAPGYCTTSGSSSNPYVCVCEGTIKLKSCT